MKYNVLIVGAGQLGSRYLQGLVGVGNKLDIYITDPNETALNIAVERWKDVGGDLSNHSLNKSINFHEIPKSIDLVICATTANVRAGVVKEVLEHSRVKYWILEKVLAQSVSDVNSIVSHIERDGGIAWVNTPRRVMNWYKDIKSALSESTFNVSISGGDWGMACNAIHYIDMFAWWSNDTIVDIDISSLEPDWFRAKRDGFWEVAGVIKIVSARGNTMILECNRNYAKTIINLSQGLTSWIIDESLCCATRNDGFKISGIVPLQSEITGTLVESIIQEGVCGLPDLKESASIHSLFLGSLTHHWHKHSKNSRSLLQIT